MADIGYMRPGVKRCALKLLALTFVRSGELRKAEWREIDMDAAEWRIPAAKMKMRRPHLVPLSRQAVETLHELHSLGKSDSFLFPALRRSKDRPMSQSVLWHSLQRLGYDKDRMCPHGFRAMAATLLSEQGWSSVLIERQLAHGDKNRVRAVYQRSEFLAERHKMMQSWADYLDQLTKVHRHPV